MGCCKGRIRMRPTRRASICSSSARHSAATSARPRRKPITTGSIMCISARDKRGTLCRRAMRLRWLVLAVACSFVSTFGCSSNHLAPSLVRVPSNWANEPAGFTPITDWALNEAPPTTGADEPISGSNGWKIVYNGSVGRSSGWVALASDSSAPFSSTVYDFVYPEGMVEGTAPGTVYYSGLNNTELYVGFWWKASSPFDYGPNGTKIAFLFNGGGDSGGQQFMIMRPDGALHVWVGYPGDFQWRPPNVNAARVTLGVWHQIEWYSDIRKGTLKWWLDGALQGTYSNVRNSHPFDMFQFSPTFGGNSGVRKRATDHYWFDHARISAP